MTAPSVSNRSLAGMALLAVVVAAGVLMPASATIAAVESVTNDPVGLAVVVAGLYLLRPLLALPTTPLAVVVGYGYGIALGVPIALVGVVATVLPVFFTARWVGASSAPSRGPIGRTLDRAVDAGSRYYETTGPTRGVVASRLAPIPSDISTCAAAVSGVRLRQFVVGTAIGELPWTVAAVVVGASAATVTTGGFGELGLALAIACTVAALALLAGPIYRTLWAAPRSGDSSRAADG